jgi:hypothetical protein
MAMAKLLALALCLISVQASLRTIPTNKTDSSSEPPPPSDEPQTEQPAEQQNQTDEVITSKFLAFHASPPTATSGGDDNQIAMEKAMTDLLLGNTAFGATPMGGSVAKIADILKNSMLPKVKAAHKSDQDEITRLIGVISKCTSDQKRLLKISGSDQAKYAKNSKAHKRCRNSEAVKFTTKKNCLVAQANLKLVKKGKCDNFAVVQGKLGTQKANRAVLAKAGSESVESYITRISTTICGKHVHGTNGDKKATGGRGGGLENGFLDQYWRARDACDKATKQYADKVKECKQKSKDYNKKKGECDQFQGIMDSSSCSSAVKAKDACESYDGCYTHAVQAYQASEKKIKSNEVDRKGEWRGLHRMSCLIDSFADGKVTGKEVDSCKKRVVDTKVMDIKYGKVPPKAKCSVPTLYPSTGAYKRAEFAPLPMLAKGKEEFFKCTAMEKKSAQVKPASGSPKTCKCNVVVLAGKFKPGKLVRCMNCKDVSKSTQKNSCPSGMKIFSPRTRADWKTFIMSARPLRAPHFIIDVTRNRDGSDGKTSYPMKSTTPRHATWRTSDASPWWLRSTGYSQPDGDYKANCFMDLWNTPHNSENNIQFNDHGCNYHSRSYYCQDKAVPKINCRMSSWSGWSRCSGSKSTRTRRVLTKASGGGSRCPSSLKETKKCRDPPNWRRIKIKSNGKCLDYNTGNNNVYMHKCHGGSNQKWYLDPKTKQIKSQRTGNRKCLDHHKSNNNAYMYSCHGGSNQQWYFDSSSRLRSKYGGKCLDDGRGNVYLHRCHGGNNQKFYWN